MTKRFLFRLVPLLVIFLLFVPWIAIAGASDDIQKGANEGIKAFFKDSRIKGLHHLGFKNQAEINNAALGEGFQIFTIPPDKLLDESTPQDIQYLATATNQWQFLIYVKKDAKALLTVDLVDGKRIPVSIGSAELASELSSIFTAWPVSSGYQYRFIRVYQAKSNFIELSQKGKVLGIIPLTSLLAATKWSDGVAFNPRTLLDPKEILSSLLPIVKQNIQMNR